MDNKLPVVESFHSLQGEGAHTGRSAFFIRLASCKVGCPWCDTKASWSAEQYPQKSILHLAKETSIAQNEGAEFLVITGGEPLHHNLDSLCYAIRSKQSIPIHLETSGVDTLSGNPDWITVSPKPHAPPRKEILKICHEIKIIIHKKDDLIFAEEIANIVNFTTQKKPLLFLQAGWHNEEGQNLAYEHVKRNKKWRLSMQTHKWLNIS